MIPTTVMELARKASGIRFSGWETEAIRASLHGGILQTILISKEKEDPSHPPYIRVACTGRGDYDELALNAGLVTAAELDQLTDEHPGDFGSPVILEIWPAGHYSPIHSHGGTTGIIYSLSGQIEAMLYDKLDWQANKMALLTLTPGQCAWLTETQFPVHKVYCPMPTGDFAATFHVYLNKEELPLVAGEPRLMSRDEFDFVDEQPPHEKKTFTTFSDLSWTILRKEMATQATGAR